VGVLRGRPGDLSLRFPYITRLMWLRTMINRPMVTYGDQSVYTVYLCSSVIHRPRHLMGLTVSWVFSLINIIYYYYYYSVDDLISNLIERLRWTWRLVFSVGSHIRLWILLCFIILFYLASLFEISVCPKSFLIWPWLVQRKSETLLWPLVGSHLLLYLFCHFTDSYLSLAIWQLKSYSNPFDNYIIR
jgi:hypothetical protein